MAISYHKVGISGVSMFKLPVNHSVLCPPSTFFHVFSVFFFFCPEKRPAVPHPIFQPYPFLKLGPNVIYLYEAFLDALRLFLFSSPKERS